MDEQPVVDVVTITRETVIQDCRDRANSDYFERHLHADTDAATDAIIARLDRIIELLTPRDNR